MSDKITLLKRHSSFSPFLRTVSALLIGAFLLQDVLYANPDIQSTVHGPQSIANKTTIYLIQDAHVNESAQRSIAKILNELIEKEKIKTVFLEAGTGDDSLSDLRVLATPQKRLDVSERFLRKGYIQGPDYLDLNSEKNFKLWGVEDKNLYYQTIELYREVQKSRDKANGFVDKIKRALHVLKIKQFNPALLDFDKQREAYLDNQYSLTEYFKAVSGIAKDKKISLLSYPHFLTLQEVLDTESAINFQKATEEQQAALSLLSSDDQAELKKALTNLSKAPEKAGAENTQKLVDVYGRLKEMLVIRSQGHKVTSMPELEKYFEYLKAVQKIGHEELLKELEEIEGHVYSALMATEEEQALIEISRTKEILHRLVNLQATSSDVRQIQRHPEKFSSIEVGGYLNRQFMLLERNYEDVIFLEPQYDKAFEKAKLFYELTQKRDEVFVRNIIDKLQKNNETKAAFVVGGYHTENLKKILREKNISTVLMMPRVLQETNLKKYEKLLLSRPQTTDHRLQTTEQKVRLSDNLLKAESIKKLVNTLPAVELSVVENGARLSVKQMLLKELGPSERHSISSPVHRGARLAKKVDKKQIHRVIDKVLARAEPTLESSIQTIQGVADVVELADHPKKELIRYYANKALNASELPHGHPGRMSKSFDADGNIELQINVPAFYRAMQSLFTDPIMPPNYSFMVSVIPSIFRESYGLAYATVAHQKSIVDLALIHDFANIYRSRDGWQYELAKFIKPLTHWMNRRFLERNRDLIYGVVSIGAAGEYYEEIAKRDAVAWVDQKLMPNDAIPSADFHLYLAESNQSVLVRVIVSAMFHTAKTFNTTKLPLDSGAVMAAAYTSFFSLQLLSHIKSKGQRGMDVSTYKNLFLTDEIPDDSHFVHSAEDLFPHVMDIVSNVEQHMGEWLNSLRQGARLTHVSRRDFIGKTSQALVSLALQTTSIDPEELEKFRVEAKKYLEHYPYNYSNGPTKADQAATEKIIQDTLLQYPELFLPENLASTGLTWAEVFVLMDHMGRKISKFQIEVWRGRPTPEPAYFTEIKKRFPDSVAAIFVDELLIMNFAATAEIEDGDAALQVIPRYIRALGQAGRSRELQDVLSNRLLYLINSLENYQISKKLDKKSNVAALRRFEAQLREQAPGSWLNIYVAMMRLEHEIVLPPVLPTARRNAEIQAEHRRHFTRMVQLDDAGQTPIWDQGATRVNEKWDDWRFGFTAHAMAVIGDLYLWKGLNREQLLAGTREVYNFARRKEQPYYASFYENNHPGARVVYILADVLKKDAPAELIKILREDSEPSEEVIDTVLNIFKKIGRTTEIVSFLISMFEDESLDVFYRTRAMDVLGDIGEASVMPRFLEISRDPSSQEKMRDAAASALRTISLRAMREINRLHESSDTVRFRNVENAEPWMLYSLMVYGDEEVYTSTFTGLFTRLLDAMRRQGMSGDQLLESVGHDRFRIFVRLMSTFNPTNRIAIRDFLATMSSSSSAEKLLSRFVSDLDKEKDPLREAVAVVDAFSELKDPRIRAQLKQQLQNEGFRTANSDDLRAKEIYKILNEMTESGEFKIPGLDTLERSDLFGADRRNVQRYHFYDDEDGKSSFESFLNQYAADKNWQIVPHAREGYIVVKSLVGAKIEIYANYPEKNEEGQMAIDHLFLATRTIPMIQVHRGHSYHVYKTLDQIKPETRFTFLGSCGGYSAISSLLKTSPRSQALTTKGVGTRHVNDPLLKMINEDIRTKGSIEWATFWRRATARFRRNADFSNYIAPPDNKGAIFISVFRSRVPEAVTPTAPLELLGARLAKEYETTVESLRLAKETGHVQVAEGFIRLPDIEYIKPAGGALITITPADDIYQHILEMPDGASVKVYASGSMVAHFQELTFKAGDKINFSNSRHSVTVVQVNEEFDVVQLRVAGFPNLSKIVEKVTLPNRGSEVSLSTLDDLRLDEKIGIKILSIKGREAHVRIVLPNGVSASIAGARLSFLREAINIYSWITLKAILISGNPENVKWIKGPLQLMSVPSLSVPDQRKIVEWVIRHHRDATLVELVGIRLLNIQQAFDGGDLRPFGARPGEMTLAGKIRSLNPELPQKLFRHKEILRDNHNVVAPLIPNILVDRIAAYVRSATKGRKYNVLVIGPGEIDGFSPLVNELMRQFTDQRLEITAVDPLAYVLRAVTKPIASRHFAKNVTIDTVHAFAEDIQSYGEGEYDMVVATAVLGYIREKNKTKFVMGQFMRALRRGGAVLMDPIDFMSQIEPNMPRDERILFNSVELFMRLFEKNKENFQKKLSDKAGFDLDINVYVGDFGAVVEIVKGARLAKRTTNQIRLGGHHFILDFFDSGSRRLLKLWKIRPNFSLKGREANSDIFIYSHELFSGSAKQGLRGIWINPVIQGQRLMRSVIRRFLNHYPDVRHVHHHTLNLVMLDVLSRDFGFVPEDDIEPNIIAANEAGKRVFYMTQQTKSRYLAAIEELIHMVPIVGSIRVVDHLDQAKNRPAAQPLYLGETLERKDASHRGARLAREVVTETHFNGYLFDVKQIDIGNIQRVDFWKVPHKIVTDLNLIPSDLYVYSLDIAGKSAKGFRGIWVNPELRGEYLMKPLLEYFLSVFPDTQYSHPDTKNLVLLDILSREFNFKPEGKLKPNAYSITENGRRVFYMTKKDASKYRQKLKGMDGLGVIAARVKTVRDLSPFETNSAAQPLYLGHALKRDTRNVQISDDTKLKRELGEQIHLATRQIIKANKRFGHSTVVSLLIIYDALVREYQSKFKIISEEPSEVKEARGQLRLKRQGARLAETDTLHSFTQKIKNTNQKISESISLILNDKPFVSIHRKNDERIKALFSNQTPAVTASGARLTEMERDEAEFKRLAGVQNNLKDRTWFIELKHLLEKRGIAGIFGQKIPTLLFVVKNEAKWIYDRMSYVHGFQLTPATLGYLSALLVSLSELIDQKNLPGPKQSLMILYDSHTGREICRSSGRYDGEKYLKAVRADQYLQVTKKLISHQGVFILGGKPWFSSQTLAGYTVRATFRLNGAGKRIISNIELILDDDSKLLLGAERIIEGSATEYDAAGNLVEFHINLASIDKFVEAKRLTEQRRLVVHKRLNHDNGSLIFGGRYWLNSVAHRDHMAVAEIIVGPEIEPYMMDVRFLFDGKGNPLTRNQSYLDRSAREYDKNGKLIRFYPFVKTDIFKQINKNNTLEMIKVLDSSGSYNLNGNWFESHRHAGYTAKLTIAFTASSNPRMKDLEFLSDAQGQPVREAFAFIDGSSKELDRYGRLLRFHPSMGSGDMDRVAGSHSLVITKKLDAEGHFNYAGTRRRFTAHAFPKHTVSVTYGPVRDDERAIDSIQLLFTPHGKKISGELALVGPMGKAAVLAESGARLSDGLEAARYPVGITAWEMLREVEKNGKVTDEVTRSSRQLHMQTAVLLQASQTRKNNYRARFDFWSERFTRDLASGQTNFEIARRGLETLVSYTLPPEDAYYYLLNLEREDFRKIVDVDPYFLFRSPARARRAWRNVFNFNPEQTLHIIHRFPRAVGYDPADIKDNWQENLGLTHEQIKEIILLVPAILGADAKTNLKVKWDLLTRMGISEDEKPKALARVSALNPTAVVMIEEIATALTYPLNTATRLDTIYKRVDRDLVKSTGRTMSNWIRKNTKEEYEPVVRTHIAQVISKIQKEEAAPSTGQKVLKAIQALKDEGYVIGNLEMIAEKIPIKPRAVTLAMRDKTVNDAVLAFTQNIEAVAEKALELRRSKGVEKVSFPMLAEALRVPSYTLNLLRHHKPREFWRVEAAMNWKPGPGKAVTEKWITGRAQVLFDRIRVKIEEATAGKKLAEQPDKVLKIIDDAIQELLQLHPPAIFNAYQISDESNERLFAELGRRLREYWNSQGLKSVAGDLNQYLAVLDYHLIPDAALVRKNFDRVMALAGGSTQERILTLWTVGVGEALHIRYFSPHPQLTDRPGELPEVEFLDNKHLIQIAREFLELLLEIPEEEWSQPVFEGITQGDIWSWGFRMMMDPKEHNLGRSRGPTTQRSGAIMPMPQWLREKLDAYAYSDGQEPTEYAYGQILIGPKSSSGKWIPREKVENLLARLLAKPDSYFWSIGMKSPADAEQMSERSISHFLIHDWKNWNYPSNKAYSYAKLDGLPIERHSRYGRDSSRDILTVLQKTRFKRLYPHLQKKIDQTVNVAVGARLTSTTSGLEAVREYAYLRQALYYASKKLKIAAAAPPANVRSTRWYMRLNEAMKAYQEAPNNIKPIRPEIHRVTQALKQISGTNIFISRKNIVTVQTQVENAYSALNQWLRTRSILEKGAFVRHPQYGYGRVQRVETRGASLTVRFRSGKIKTLAPSSLKRYLRLSEVSSVLEGVTASAMLQAAGSGRLRVEKLSGWPVLIALNRLDEIQWLFNPKAYSGYLELRDFSRLTKISADRLHKSQSFLPDEIISFAHKQSEKPKVKRRLYNSDRAEAAKDHFMQSYVASFKAAERIGKILKRKVGSSIKRALQLGWLEEDTKLDSETGERHFRHFTASRVEKWERVLKRARYKGRPIISALRLIDNTEIENEAVQKVRELDGRARRAGARLSSDVKQGLVARRRGPAVEYTDSHGRLRRVRLRTAAGSVELVNQAVEDDYFTSHTFDIYQKKKSILSSLVIAEFDKTAESDPELLIVDFEIDKSVKNRKKIESAILKWLATRAGEEDRRFGTIGTYDPEEMSMFLEFLEPESVRYQIYDRLHPDAPQPELVREAFVKQSGFDIQIGRYPAMVTVVGAPKYEEKEYVSTRRAAIIAGIDDNRFWDYVNRHLVKVDSPGGFHIARVRRWKLFLQELNRKAEVSPASIPGILNLIDTHPLAQHPSDIEELSGLINKPQTILYDPSSKTFVRSSDPKQANVFLQTLLPGQVLKVQRKLNSKGGYRSEYGQFYAKAYRDYTVEVTYVAGAAGKPVMTAATLIKDPKGNILTGANTIINGATTEYDKDGRIVGFYVNLSNEAFKVIQFSKGHTLEVDRKMLSSTAGAFYYAGQQWFFSRAHRDQLARVIYAAETGSQAQVKKVTFTYDKDGLALSNPESFILQGDLRKILVPEAAASGARLADSQHKEISHKKLWFVAGLGLVGYAAFVAWAAFRIIRPSEEIVTHLEEISKNPPRAQTATYWLALAIALEDKGVSPNDVRLARLHEDLLTAAEWAQMQGMEYEASSEFYRVFQDKFTERTLHRVNLLGTSIPREVAADIVKFYSLVQAQGINKEDIASQLRDIEARVPIPKSIAGARLSTDVSQRARYTYGTLVEALKSRQAIVGDEARDVVIATEWGDVRPWQLNDFSNYSRMDGMFYLARDISVAIEKGFIIFDLLPTGFNQNQLRTLAEPMKENGLKAQMLSWKLYFKAQEELKADKGIYSGFTGQIELARKLGVNTLIYLYLAFGGPENPYGWISTPLTTRNIDAIAEELNKNPGLYREPDKIAKQISDKLNLSQMPVSAIERILPNLLVKAKANLLFDSEVVRKQLALVVLQGSRRWPAVWGEYPEALKDTRAVLHALYWELKSEIKTAEDLNISTTEVSQKRDLGISILDQTLQKVYGPTADGAREILTGIYTERIMKALSDGNLQLSSHARADAKSPRTHLTGQDLSARTVLGARKVLSRPDIKNSLSSEDINKMNALTQKPELTFEDREELRKIIDRYGLPLKGARLSQFQKLLAGIIPLLLVSTAYALPVQLVPESPSVVMRVQKDRQGVVGHSLETGTMRVSGQNPPTISSSKTDLYMEARSRDTHVRMELNMIAENRVSLTPILIQVDPKILGEKALDFAKVIDESRKNRVLRNVYFVLVRHAGEDAATHKVLNALKNTPYQNIFLEAIPRNLRDAIRVNLWAEGEPFEPTAQEINLLVHPFGAQDEILKSSVEVMAYAGRVWLNPPIEYVNALATLMNARPTTEVMQRMFSGTLDPVLWARLYTLRFTIGPADLNLERQALGARMTEQAA